MEVAVLPPQDCLRRPHHQYHHQQNRRQLISPASKPRRNPHNASPNPNKSSRRRRNSPPPPPSNGPTKAQQPRPKSPPVMGQVRILRRGEDIDLSPPRKPDPPVRAEPAPVLDGFYAGTAFVTSPPPSSLPLPAFFKRSEAHKQEIASELKKVLKLL